MRLLRSRPGQRRSSSSSRAGATLVELVIASAILSIALLGALTGHVASRKLLSNSAEKGVALEILRTEMNQALAFDTTTILNGNGHHALDACQKGVTPLLEDSQLTFTLVDYVPGASEEPVLNLKYELQWIAKDGVPQEMTLISATR